MQQADVRESWYCSVAKQLLQLDDAVTQFVRTESEAPVIISSVSGEQIERSSVYPEDFALAATSNDVTNEFHNTGINASKPDITEKEQSHPTAATLCIRTEAEAPASISSISVAEDEHSSIGLCPPELALNAVELSVGTNMVKTFEKWYATKKSYGVEHALYHKWKMYKNQLTHGTSFRTNLENANVKATAEDQINKTLNNEQTSKEQQMKIDIDELIRLCIADEPALIKEYDVEHSIKEQGDIIEHVLVEHKRVANNENTPTIKQSTSRRGMVMKENDSSSPNGHSSLADIEKCKPATGEFYFPFNNTSYPGDCDSDVLSYPMVTKKVTQNPKNKPKYFILTSTEVIAAKKDFEETKKETEKKKEESRMRKLHHTSTSGPDTKAQKND